MATPDAERRRVCVLFCDIVGSTTLSQRLDAEDLKEVIDAYQSVCGDVVQRHDGYVAQYLGDGILIYFGYPHAHEDDALRAVNCALEMLEAVERLGAAKQLELQLRIGIHSGRVVVGALGGIGRSERLAVGDTPNLAARVQGEAPPGAVVVSDALWRLLPRTVSGEPMSFRPLRGVEQPLQLYRVFAGGTHAAGDGTSRTPFTGRTQERARIAEAWACASKGTPQFVLVRGEPGIGKSRLLEVVREELASQGVDVLVARSTPLTTDSALHPFIELLGARLGLAGASAEERLKRVIERVAELGLAAEEAVPLLSTLLSIPVDPLVWPGPDLSPVRARQRTMDLIIEGLHALAQRWPVLLVLEDVHWADHSTVDLLRQLISTSRTGRLIAIITARPEFKPTWAAATNLIEVELEPLGEADAESIIRKVARDKRLPPSVLWPIRERAAGNPLFLEEITRSVVESGALVEHEKSWELVGTVDADVVPVSMEASLMARIDRLGDARPLLQLGAALGREFSHELLLAVSQVPPEEFTLHVERMLTSGLIFRLTGTTPIYVFKHALVRDAAYDSLLRATRQKYHARIAEVLLTHFPDVAHRRPEFLAHHLSGAGSWAEAAAQWQAAGEDAARRSAVNEAVAHLRRALTDLERLPEDTARLERELSVLSTLAPVLMAVYGWAAPVVGETATRAIDLASRLGAHDRMYGPLWALWTNQFVGGRLREGMESAIRVGEMAESTGDPLLQLTGRHATSYTRYYRGEYALALVEAEAGLKHFLPEREHALCQVFQLSSTVNVMVAKGSSLWMLGRQDEGIAVMDEMLALARSLRHPPSIAGALAFQMFLSLYDRDWNRLFEFSDEVFDLARAEGFAMWTANGGMHRGRARVGLGEVEAGLAELLEWGALFRQTGSGIVEGSTTSMVSEGLHMDNRSEEALAASLEGERRAKAGMVRVMEPEIYRTRANILRDLGRLDEADATYQMAAESARNQSALSLELRALTALLELQLARGERTNTPDALRRALDGMVCRADRPDLVAAREVLSLVKP